MNCGSSQTETGNMPVVILFMKKTINKDSILSLIKQEIFQNT